MIHSSAYQQHVGSIQITPGRIRIHGWVFHPTEQIDSVSVALDGHTLVDDLKLIERPDVLDAFPQYTTSLRSGYEFEAPFEGPPGTAHDALLVITPISGGKTLRAVHAVFCDSAHELKTRPQPPFHLMQRVGGAKNYEQVGPATLSLILTNLASVGPMAAAGRVLDWGCGSGRIAAHLAKFIDPNRVYGSDIDREAVDWAASNIPGPHFSAIPTYPPTEYPDSFFDRIYGISVMTHLDEDAQLQWLRELHRISQPGAGILLSIIGVLLRATNMPSSLMGEYARNGFATFVPAYEQALGFREFSPEGYYKESYHTPDYVDRVWGQFFDVVEYVETGYQDLVLLRRR